MRQPPLFKRLLGLALTGFLVACAAPGGGDPSAVPETASFRSAEEQRTGREAHPKILERFGGAYDNPRLTAYVNRIGRDIAAVSEQPNEPWTFTVLDTPTINAFALPGGYVYVTRGLVGLADSEAELAGVIGHEIGHVTAGHSALRQQRSQVAGLGVLLGGIGLAVAGVDPSVARGVLQAGQAAAGGIVASYSRGDELAADNLGVRYLARAGYDPYAQADFLDTMGDAAALEAELAGQAYNREAVDFFASHPATGQRTRQAIQVAQEAGAVGTVGADRRRDAFLDAIDGMTYGEHPEQGIVEGRRFIHPPLRFAYEVPQGYQISNGSTAVVAAGPGKARLILESARDEGGDLATFIAQSWAPAIANSDGVRTGQLQNLSRTRINGLDAAEAVLPLAIQNQRVDAMLVAIRHRGAIYRFTGLQEPGAGAFGEMRAAAGTFRALSANEAAQIQPRRIEIVRAGQGDTVARLAGRMRIGTAREARFRLLNSLGPGDPLQPDQRVKLVR